MDVVVFSNVHYGHFFFKVIKSVTEIYILCEIYSKRNELCLREMRYSNVLLSVGAPKEINRIFFLLDLKK